MSSHTKGNRRLSSAVAVGAVVGAMAFSGAASAAPAASQKYFLNVQDCKRWEVSPSAAGSGNCAVLPKFMLAGRGLSVSESFAGFGKPARLSPSGKVTGTVYAVMQSPGIESGPSVPTFAGPVAADFTVRVNGVSVGVVHLDGVASPLAAAKADFALALPAKLAGVRLKFISVEVQWMTCAMVCAVNVSGSEHSWLTVPLG